MCVCVDGYTGTVCQHLPKRSIESLVYTQFFSCESAKKVSAVFFYTVVPVESKKTAKLHGHIVLGAFIIIMLVLFATATVIVIVCWSVYRSISRFVQSKVVLLF